MPSASRVSFVLILSLVNTHGITYDLFCAQILDDSEVEPALTGGDVRDVADPGLIRQAKADRAPHQLMEAVQTQRRMLLMQRNELAKNSLIFLFSAAWLARPRIF